jgi:glycosyltransferase involved in cell wall biosynthesis
VGARYWQPALAAGASVNVIVNALDVSAIRAAPPPILALAIEGRSLILVVGRLNEQKATDVVLQAIALVGARFEFLVLFMGEGPGRAAVEAAARTAPGRNRVAVVGYNPQWWGLLKMARGLVSASRFEGAPNVVLEAMAGGCPLIVSDIPEHREILDERGALLVRPEDPKALAAAIEALLADPAAARRRASQAAERVEELTIDKAADAYDRIYQQVISRRQHQCVES